MGAWLESMTCVSTRCDALIVAMSPALLCSTHKRQCASLRWAVTVWPPARPPSDGGMHSHACYEIELVLRGWHAWCGIGVAAHLRPPAVMAKVGMKLERQLLHDNAIGPTQRHSVTVRTGRDHIAGAAAVVAQSAGTAGGLVGPGGKCGPCKLSPAAASAVPMRLRTAFTRGGESKRAAGSGSGAGRGLEQHSTGLQAAAGSEARRLASAVPAQ